MSESKPGIASRLASQSGLVVLGNLFTLFAGIPFQIYLARTLGAEQLGAFGLFETIAQTAASIFGFGLGFTLVRFIPQLTTLGKSRHARALLSTVFSMTLLGGVFATVLIMAGGRYLIEWMPELQAYAHLFPFVGAMAIIGMLIGISQQTLRAFLDIRYMVLVSSFMQLMLKILIAVMLLWLGWELMGYLIAVILSAGLALFGMAWGIRKHLRHLSHTHEEILPATRKTWWSYSRTMYANSLLGIADAPLERFLLAGMINLTSVGILMVVRQLQSLPQVLLQIIILAIAPMFVTAKTRDDMDEVKHLYYIATDWVCRLGLPLLVFLLVFGDKVLELYGADFATLGYWPFLTLLMGQLVNLLTGPIGVMLNMLGYEKKIFQLNLISSGLYIVCLLLLVPLLGLLGVALGSVFSMVYMNIMASHIMKKELGITWWSMRHKRLLAPLATSLSSALFGAATNIVQGIWLLAMAFVGVYGVFFLVYLSKGLSREDKEIYAMLRVRLGIAKEAE